MLAHKGKSCSFQTYTPLSLRIWYLAVKKYALLIVLKTSLTRNPAKKQYTLTPKIRYPHFPYPLIVSKNPLNSIICISASSSQFFNFEETTSNFSLKEKWMKIFSHFKPPPILSSFTARIENWLRSRKPNFTHGIKKWKAINTLLITLLGIWRLLYWVLADNKWCWLKRESSTRSSWIQVSPAYSWNGEKQCHKNKILEKMLTFKHP